jgi:hypothetical protein
MEAGCSSETLVDFQRTTCPYTTEDKFFRDSFRLQEGSRNIILRISWSEIYNVVPPPIQLVAGLFPRMQSGRDVKLRTHFHLVPQLRTGGDILPFNYTSSWRILN